MRQKIGLPDTLLLRANTPPIVVARQLGHKNMETTLRTYAHVTDDFMDHEFRAQYKPGFPTSPDLFNAQDKGDMVVDCRP